MSKAAGPLSGGAKLPGKGLANAQTRNSSGVVCQTREAKLPRGPEVAISGKAQLPGRGLSNTQTRRSSTVVDQTPKNTTRYPS